jgi:hypothetical protein
MNTNHCSVQVLELVTVSWALTGFCAGGGEPENVLKMFLCVSHLRLFSLIIIQYLGYKNNLLKPL